jgi:hypothetical protein
VGEPAGNADIGVAEQDLLLQSQDLLLHFLYGAVGTRDLRLQVKRPGSRVLPQA